MNNQKKFARQELELDIQFIFFLLLAGSLIYCVFHGLYIAISYLISLV